MTNEQESEEVRRFKATKIEAEQGDAIAQLSLSQMYEKGEGVPQNYAEALKWSAKARKTAEQGGADVQFKFGDMYYFGQGVPKNYVEAAKWYEMAAEQGHAEAQNKLGEMHRKGQGVEKNDKEAAKWYEMAAKQGHAEAQIELGCMYANGEGVSQDYDKAARWLWKAKRGGDVSPQGKKLLIGVMYLFGRLRKNDVEGYAWFLLAKENGDKKDSELISFIEDIEKDLTAEAMEKGQARAAELSRLIKET